MGQIEIACRNFVKHRGKQEEIILADERHFEIWITAFLELERGV
jgi:hypothetical protein